MTKRMVQFGVLCVMLAGVVSVNAAVIFSDDFSTDPFAAPARWTSVYDGTFNSTWYKWNSSQQAMNRFGDGRAHMETVATTSADASLGYSIDFDFVIANQLGGGRRIGVWAQRQSDGSHYYIHAYVGGDGKVDWTSGGGGMNDIHNGVYEGPLALNQWYTFHAECFDTGNQIELKAVIYDQGTTNIAVPWSATAVDTTRAYTTNAGFAYYEDSPGANYWDYNTYTDNFVVNQVPEPATIGLLVLGVLGLIRRRIA